MAHLHHVSPEEAEARGAADFYDRFRSVTGAAQPTPFWQAQSVRPDLTVPLFGWFEKLMLEDGMLGRALKEMIATRTSYANGCRYCSAAHSSRAVLYGVDPSLVDRLAEPLEELPLEPRVRALLAFGDKVRDASTTVEGSDWQALRDLSWSEEEIVEALQVVGMFSAFNRMADSLGVEFVPPGSQPEPAGQPDPAAESQPAAARSS
jgi:uncharacterized peroxidase-related enzyme